MSFFLAPAAEELSDIGALLFSLSRLRERGGVRVVVQAPGWLIYPHPNPLPEEEGVK